MQLPLFIDFVTKIPARFCLYVNNIIKTFSNHIYSVLQNVKSLNFDRNLLNDVYYIMYSKIFLRNSVCDIY